MKFQLFTAQFQRFTEDMGTPVRSSNGSPRWPLPYTLNYAAKETFPLWALVKSDLPEEEFRAQYHAGLDKVGVPKLADRFNAIREGGGDDRIVLMCFDDLSKPGMWCHRTMFAEWWTENTGQPVIELGPTGPPPREVTLFD